MSDRGAAGARGRTSAAAARAEAPAQVTGGLAGGARGRDRRRAQGRGGRGGVSLALLRGWRAPAPARGPRSRCMKAARPASPRSMRRSSASHSPVRAGLLASGWTRSTRPMPLSVAASERACRSTYPRRTRASMISARVAGVPRPRSFIASASSRSSRVRPAVSMAVSRVASVNRRGGRVRRATASASTTAAARPGVRPGGKAGPSSLRSFGRPSLRAGSAPRAVRGTLRGRGLEHLPADLVHDRAARVEAIDHGIGPGAAHPRDHGGDGEDVLVVPGHEQAPADQVVDAPLGRRERQALGGNPGGEEGVVIGDLARRRRTAWRAAAPRCPGRAGPRRGRGSPARPARRVAATSVDRWRESVRG